MIEGLYDKTSKISFSTYKDDFKKYFQEYKKIIREMETEVQTLQGSYKRLDKLVLVDDDTLENWEFEFKKIDKDTLKKIWEYNKLKSAQTGKIVDSFIISFANPDLCEESIKIGRSIVFAPIIRYLQNMHLTKKLNNIEVKVKDNECISIEDELTLIFVALSVKNADKEEIVKRVCAILDEIDYIEKSRRVIIDSLISYQIENSVKSKKDQDMLNKVVDMQMSVEDIFIQAERDYEFNSGFDYGMKEGIKEGIKEGKKDGIKISKDEIILNMLNESVDDESIQRLTGCSRQYLQEFKREHSIE
ncbi:MAG: hypothetical protein IJ258_07745 [Methanobrevibacter sp.]|uniref:hypothetical protein n=1 Tax=Methanobrevibacter sp. TaxID=66852 RepID=UPI0025EC50A0|nr:hypothetical protein [Methanobrevibacter sp.]MBQ8017983.1 hypothetical protein [Methanobrevibacter sp.]